MPRLWPLFYVREGRGIASNDGDLDMGLENLPSLQDVVVILRSEGTSNEEAEQAMAALTHATEMHPQHPRHDIHIEYEGVVTPVIILSRYSNTSSLLYFLLTLILFSIQSQVEMTNNEIEAKI